MSHKVLSRRYRPQRFDELRGQAAVSRILTQALISERVGHAYLFVGPRGVGKTTTARIFARALNCAGRQGAEDLEPCGACPSCVDIAAGRDLDVVEMDAASNNAVEDVRALREQVGYAAARSPNRIWIVDEVHMLSLPAFNAFLKTLEEPPERVKFIFCTTEEHKLPDTFRSRCQRVEFCPIADTEMAARLTELAALEGATLEEGLAQAIAQGALGGLRDAESMLEQLLAASGGGELTRADLDTLGGRASGPLLDELFAAIDQGEAGAALDAVDACLAGGSKPGVLMDQWLDGLRNRLLSAARAPRQERGAHGSVARLARSVDVLLAKRAHLKTGADGTLIVQVAAIELARLPDARDLDALVRALKGQEDSVPAAGATFEDDGERPASTGRSVARKSTPAPVTRDGTAAPPSPALARQLPAAAPPAAVRHSPAGEAAAPTRAAPPPGDAVVLTRAPATSRAQQTLEPIQTLAGLQGLWPQLIDVATQREPRLAEALANAVPVSLRDDRLRVRLPAGAAALRGVLLRREMQLAFGQAVRELAGAYLNLELEEFVAPSGSQAEVAPELRAHPTIQRVTERTGGRLLHVERLQGSDGEEDDAHA